MNIKKDHYYAKDHEWIRVEGDLAYIGISDFAQHSLGNIVFLELPANTGVAVKEGDTLGVVESVKAASDIYFPISGTIVKVNNDLMDTPEKLNEDPFGSWLVAITLTDASQLSSLMDSTAYEIFCQEEA